MFFCAFFNIFIKVNLCISRGKINFYTPKVELNNNINESLQKFVCAHELGHAVLHPKANTPFLKRNTFYSLDKIEVEANTFAVELLLPDEQLYEYKDTSLSIYEICELYGVPKELSHLKKF
jgi:Zn-dependent peptidase ImmA (M78 family)